MSQNPDSLFHSLEHARKNAKDLVKAHAAGDPNAAERINKQLRHPHVPFKLADALRVVAREHGQPSWAALKEHLLFPQLQLAVAAMDAGDNETLRDLLVAEPSLVRFRTPYEKSQPVDYFTGAQLLHYVAGNPNRGDLPASIVESAKILLEAGADPKEKTTSGSDVIGLILSSRDAADAGVGGPLVDLLLEAGGQHPKHSEETLLFSLRNSAFETARQFMQRGYPVGLRAAAGLGNINLVRELLEHPSNIPATLSKQEELDQALSYATTHQHLDIAALLLEHGANIDSIPAVFPNSGTALHMAPTLEIARFLVERGADLFVRDPTYSGTPADWAFHCGHPDIEKYLRECMTR